MQKSRHIQTSFAAGEVSPALLGRVDIERFFSAAERVENFYVRPQGGLFRRLGTGYLATSIDADAEIPSRLVTFAYSRNEAEAIEFSPTKLRFFKDNALVLDGGSPYEVTGLPYSASEIWELQFTQSADVLFITHPNHPQATLSRYGNLDWRYEIPQFDYGPYLDQEPGDQNFSLTLLNIIDRATLRSTASDFGSLALNDLIEYPYRGTWVLGRVVNAISANEVEIEPYEDRSLFLSKEVYSPGLYAGWDGTNSIPTYTGPISGTGVQVAFSNSGTLTQEHVGNYLRFMDSSGTYYWMLVNEIADIVRQGAYGIIAVGDILNVSVPTGIVTRSERTITADLYASDSNFFDLSVDVPRLFRLVLGEEIVHARSYSDGANTTSMLKVYLNRPVPRSREGAAIVQDGTTNDWNAGAWFPGNYPSTVFFHEERLGFGGTYYEPQTGWLSKTADFYNFAATDNQLRVMDDSAITFTVASDTVNQILWAVTKGALLVGTAGGEWAIGASGGSQTALTATNATVQGQSFNGSAFIKPVTVGKSVLYLQTGGNRLWKMAYQQQSEAMISDDLTVFADHILKDHGGGIQLAYQALPDPVLYVLMADGQLGVLTYEEEQQVFAWSRFIAGGPNAKIESIASVPEGSRYRLYMVVKRTVNGGNFRTVETLVPEFRPSSSIDYTNVKFLDGHIVRTTGLSASMTGLSQFAACTVDALVDNAVYHGLSVSNEGNLALPVTPASRVVIGFSYRSLIKTLPTEVQTQAGTTQGNQKRITHLKARFLNSIGMSFGVEENALREESFVSTASPLNNMPPMFTGDRRVEMPNGYDARASYFVTQSRAYPLNILALMPDVNN